MNKQLKNNKLMIYNKNLTSCRLSCLVDQTLSLDQHYPETVQPKWEKIIKWVKKEYKKYNDCSQSNNSFYFLTLAHHNVRGRILVVWQ